ncbi:hypothetical protein A0H81_07536 [Grifola frondosa]|uniref:Uncharacterized protein n=1 Tax=Grifola frondosa TaxID=5627 RepID=A0A1C7M799_GRIFR|nr:hypothetical protein A0H81_07536 [Grifola frondosa]
MLKRRRARACDPESVTDENLQKRPLRSEKHVTFQEPKAPDLVTLPVLSRESHTPSCSTCPDDVPLHSGAGWDAPIDWRIYATNGEDEFEDVTDILAMPVSESESGSEHDQQSSRASGGAASLTPDSYTTCESRYSSPSIEEGASAPSASIASELHSPSPPPSELIRTPAQPEYIPETGVVALNRNSTGSADTETDPEWDVAHTYDPSSRTKTSDPVLDKVTGTIAVGGRTCVLIHG